MSTSDLFRKEVLSSQANAWLGGVRVITPVSHLAWAAGSVSIVALLLLFLGLSHYSRREHVSGVLSPREGLITLSAHANGTVSKLLVQVGAKVGEGQPLLTLSTEKNSENLGDTAAHVSADLRGQLTFLAGELKNTVDAERNQRQDIQMQVSMLQRQLEHVSNQLAIEQRRQRTLSALLEKLEPLRTKGYVSAFDIQQQQTQELDAESQAEALSRQCYELRQQLESAKHQLTALPLTTKDKISDLQQKYAQIHQELESNEADRSTVIRSPRAGMISSAIVNVGEEVSAGQALITIIPANTPLMAELLVPSSAMGFIHPGGEVKLHYQAFPYEKFGAQAGVIESLPESALKPNEVAVLMGDKIPEQSMYRVLVKLDEQQILAYGHAETLKAGMAVDADLVLEKRPLIEWIFEPLYGMGRN